MARYSFIIFLLIAVTVIIKPQPRMAGGKITGIVLDSSEKAPIEYANVVLFSMRDSAQVTGGVTDTEGRFELINIRPGQYYLEVLFMGYERERISGIQLGRGGMAHDAGTILIKPTSLLLNDVVVEAEQSPITYQIDKKVLDVDKLSTTISGTAAEVLENIPSVTVDIEGNVSLRGSGSFTILIDGRPTIMDAQEALQTIPATSIDDIEIITNPSAKYDPEGTAGIINIVLKKNERRGVNGLMNLNAGLRDKFGGEALLEYKLPAVSTLLSVDYNRRFFPVTNGNEQEYNYAGSTNYVHSSGDSRWGREFYGIRAGLDFNLGENDYLGLGGRYRYRDMGSTSHSFREEWSTNNPTRIQLFNNSDRSRDGHNYDLSLNYLHKFGGPGHELQADFSFQKGKSDELTITELSNGTAITDGRRSTEGGDDTELEGRINYSLPLANEGKFEAGAEGEKEFSDEITGLAIYRTDSGLYEYLPQFHNDIRYDESELSVYSTYAGKLGNFGYQAGVRGEYTYRSIELTNRSNNFKIDQWDYFPTMHLSYNIAPGHQAMASYTRRINRPGTWSLEPFEVWTDANNVRIGNPGLKPELVDAYELGMQSIIGQASVSGEVYYRVQHNKIEEIQSLYNSNNQDNVTLHTFENLGTDYSLGTEMMVLFDPLQLWNVNLMGNIYHYRIESILEDRSSFNWQARMQNSLKITSTLEMQVNMGYHSPSVSAQGRREGFLMTGLAVKKEFLEKKLALTLQIRDLFGTGKHESYTNGIGFSSYNYMEREAPMVMLNVRYLINNFRQERENRNGDGEEGGMEEQF